MPIFGKKTFSKEEKERLLLQGGYLQQQGESKRKEKNLPGAVRDYEQALKLYRQAEEPLAIGRALQGLGMFHRDLGNFNEAENYLNQALKIFHSLYDSFRQGTTYDRLGTLYYQMGDNRRSTEMYLKASDYLIEAGSFKDAIFALAAAASLEIDANHAVQGESIIRRALQVAMDEKISDEEPHVLYILGLALCKQDRNDEAIPVLTRVLLLEDEMHIKAYGPQANKELKKLGADVNMETVAIPISDPRIEAALELFRQGKPQSAIAQLQELLSGYDATKQAKDAAGAYEALGNIHQSLGHSQEALDLYDKALELYQKCGMQDSVGRVTMVIGLLQREKDNFVL
ncbi:MAG: tetratricopeptide repeat protein [Anaerolineaceae bacterium]|nr:tetratricopeptide repeat protein [Anaerolineaceae bacterium]